jgi:hypothetical protein
MWHLLTANSTAIQAVSALASVFLTIVLIVVTIRYVKMTQRMVGLSEKQFRSGIQPQLSVDLEWIDNGDQKRGVFHFKNVGPNSFIITRGEFSWYCRRSEQTLVEPREFPLMHWRVLPPGQETHETFNVNPLTADIHEAHEGECEWIFRTEVQLEDLAGILRHEYSFDESLGLHYIRDYTAQSWWSKTRIRWHNRWAFTKYRLKALRQRVRKRTTKTDTSPRS